jgi:hypothetical protein
VQPAPHTLFSLPPCNHTSQAQAALLPSSPLLLSQPGVSASEQLQHGAADLPGLLKGSGSDVDMSLVLKAAREIPLEMLAAEYDKV